MVARTLQHGNGRVHEAAVVDQWYEIRIFMLVRRMPQFTGVRPMTIY